jgi:hypothetical protein
MENGRVIDQLALAVICDCTSKQLIMIGYYLKQLAVTTSCTKTEKVPNLQSTARQT